MLLEADFASAFPFKPDVQHIHITVNASKLFSNKGGSYSDCHMSPQCRWQSPAHSQLCAQQPRTQHALLGCLQLQPALQAALSIFPSHMPERSTGLQSATLMVFNGQQIPQKCPFPSAKVHQGEKTCYLSRLPPRA